MGIASCLDLRLVADGLTDRELRRELMHWQRRVAALFVVLALASCAQGNTGQAGADIRPIRRRTTRVSPSTAAEMAGAVVALCSQASALPWGRQPGAGDLGVPGSMARRLLRHRLIAPLGPRWVSR